MNEECIYQAASVSQDNGNFPVKKTDNLSPEYKNELSIFHKETLQKVEEFRAARRNWVTSYGNQALSANKLDHESSQYRGRCPCLRRFKFKNFLRDHRKTAKHLKFYSLKRKLSDSKACKCKSDSKESLLPENNLKLSEECKRKILKKLKKEKSDLKDKTCQGKKSLLSKYFGKKNGEKRRKKMKRKGEEHEENLNSKLKPSKRAIVKLIEAKSSDEDKHLLIAPKDNHNSDKSSHKKCCDKKSELTDEQLEYEEASFELTDSFIKLNKPAPVCSKNTTDITNAQAKVPFKDATNLKDRKPRELCENCLKLIKENIEPLEKFTCRVKSSIELHKKRLNKLNINFTEEKPEGKYIKEKDKTEPVTSFHESVKLSPSIVYGSSKTSLVHSAIIEDMTPKNTHNSTPKSSNLTIIPAKPSSSISSREHKIISGDILPKKISGDAFKSSNSSTHIILEIPKPSKEYIRTPKRSKECIITPKQSKQCIQTPKRSKECIITPKQSKQCIQTPKRSKESIITPKQSKQCIQTPKRSKESIITPKQSKQCIQTPKQSKECIITPKQSKQCIQTPKRSKESIITPKQSKETTKRSKECIITPKQSKETPKWSRECVITPKRSKECVITPKQSKECAITPKQSKECAIAPKQSKETTKRSKECIITPKQSKETPKWSRECVITPKRSKECVITPKRSMECVITPKPSKECVITPKRSTEYIITPEQSRECIPTLKPSKRYLSYSKKVCKKVFKPPKKNKRCPKPKKFCKDTPKSSKESISCSKPKKACKTPKPSKESIRCSKSKKIYKTLKPLYIKAKKICKETYKPSKECVRCSTPKKVCKTPEPSKEYIRCSTPRNICEETCEPSKEFMGYSKLESVSTETPKQSHERMNTPKSSNPSIRTPESSKVLPQIPQTSVECAPHSQPEIKSKVAPKSTIESIIDSKLVEICKASLRPLKEYIININRENIYKDRLPLINEDVKSKIKFFCRLGDSLKIKKKEICPKCGVNRTITEKPCQKCLKLRDEELQQLKNSIVMRKKESDSKNDTGNSRGITVENVCEDLFCPSDTLLGRVIMPSYKIFDYSVVVSKPQLCPKDKSTLDETEHVFEKCSQLTEESNVKATCSVSNENWKSMKNSSYMVYYSSENLSNNDINKKLGECSCKNLRSQERTNQLGTAQDKQTNNRRIDRGKENEKPSLRKTEEKLKDIKKDLVLSLYTNPVCNGSTTDSAREESIKQGRYVEEKVFVKF